MFSSTTATTSRLPSPLTDARFRPYRPYGSAEKVLYCRDPEVLLHGPAGTGKSRAILEKMNLCASKYPGSRYLFVRKTRESLTQSGVVTLEKFVIPDNGTVRFRTSEQEYRYANGSTIVLGGLDKASKILSSEYDMIYVQEATEITEDDWEHLTTRARFGILPYNQTIGDCNPGHPRHWLHLRMLEGKLTAFFSQHKDNPKYYDHEKDDWTKNGLEYLKKLSNLTGVRRRRFFLGEWAAAEGMIYEDIWKPDVHIVPRFKIPLRWRRVWVVDFGFAVPLVWQAWAISPDGDCYCYAEIYQRQLLNEDAASTIKNWKRREAEPYPEAVVCDWDAEGRATLERHLGIDTIPAGKSILDGIEAVKSLLRSEDDAEPHMFFMQDSLLEVDEDLRETGLPWKTTDEFDGYEWDDKKKKDMPRQVDDHGMDCTRYFADYVVSEGDYGGWSRGPAG